MSENTVAKEVAEQEFERFVREMGLKLDTALMDAEDLNAFIKTKSRVIEAIEEGALIINENGEPIFTPQRKNSKHQEPIIFHERTGASLMAMDGAKKGHDVKKMYAVLADMCRVHPSVFAGLAGTDIKLCESLFSLLMD